MADKKKADKKGTLSETIGGVWEWKTVTVFSQEPALPRKKATRTHQTRKTIQRPMMNQEEKRAKWGGGKAPQRREKEKEKERLPRDAGIRSGAKTTNVLGGAMDEGSMGGGRRKRVGNLPVGGEKRLRVAKKGKMSHAKESVQERGGCAKKKNSSCREGRDPRKKESACPYPTKMLKKSKKLNKKRHGTTKGRRRHSQESTVRPVGGGGGGFQKANRLDRGSHALEPVS